MTEILQKEDVIKKIIDDIKNEKDIRKFNYVIKNIEKKILYQGTEEEIRASIKTLVREYLAGQWYSRKVDEINIALNKLNRRCENKAHFVLEESSFGRLKIIKSGEEIKDNDCQMLYNSIEELVKKITPIKFMPDNDYSIIELIQIISYADSILGEQVELPPEKNLITILDHYKNKILDLHIKDKGSFRDKASAEIDEILKYVSARLQAKSITQPDDIVIAEEAKQYMLEWMQEKYASIFKMYEKMVKDCEPDRTGYSYDAKNNIFRVVSADRPCTTLVMGFEDTLRMLNGQYEKTKNNQYMDEASKKIVPLDLLHITSVKKLIENSTNIFKNANVDEKKSFLSVFNKKNILLVIAAVIIVVLLIVIVVISTNKDKFTIFPIRDRIRRRQHIMIA